MPLQAFALKWKCAKLEQGERKMLEKMKEKRAWDAVRCLFTLIVWPTTHIQWERGREELFCNRPIDANALTSSSRDKQTPR